jgi:hypothetical protein
MYDLNSAVDNHRTHGGALHTLAAAQEHGTGQKNGGRLSNKAIFSGARKRVRFY